MKEVNRYPYSAVSQDADFTACAKFSSVVRNVLTTAGEDARRRGFGAEAMARHNLGWVLSRLAIELDRRPREDEEYFVETWVTEYTALKTTRCFRLIDADGGCFGRAVSYFCILDFIGRSLAPIERLKEVADTSVVDVPLPCRAPEKMHPFQAVPVSSHKVKYMDIDFNRHMNSLRYIDLMLDELPIDFVSENKPLRCDLHYLRETVYGQSLDILRDGGNFALRRDDGNLAVLAKFARY